MNDEFDREKIVDCMFDPVTSSIIAELEEGPKDCSILATQSSISESEVLDRLSYLIDHKFISIQKNEKGSSVVEANFEKLNSIVENNDNFDQTISSLEKMDSYLN